mgnify:CR=1 FL=1
MKAIPFEKRKNWQLHIRENAYQADVLSDESQKYWVESLEKPFYIKLTNLEEEKLAHATAKLGEMCKEYLDWFFTENEEGETNERLAKLKIPEQYWRPIKKSWERTCPEDLSLYMRFDLVMDESYSYLKLIEINAETPLLGCEQVYQWNWLQDMLLSKHHSIPSESSQFNEFWDKVCEQWSYIIRTYNTQGKIIYFLVDETLNEDIEMAAQLVQMIQDKVAPNQYCQLVYLRDLRDERGNLIQKGLGIDEEGHLVDHFDQRIEFLWKIYDWSDLQNDLENFGMTEVFVKQLGLDTTRFIEPLWKQVLANKGSLVFMWNLFKCHPDYSPYLLETYFEDDLDCLATRLLLRPHIRKPLMGLEGVATSIHDGQESLLEKKDSLGYGHEGFIIQEFIPLPSAYGYYYVLGSWLVGGLEDGEPAGVIIRGDQSLITGRYCLIIPHIVSDK